MGSGGNRIIHAILGFLLATGIVVFAVRWHGGQKPVGVESFLVSLLMASLSWVVSSYISSSSASRKAESNAQATIDAIAQQSSNKLSHQSTQLFDIEEHINEVLLGKFFDQGKVDETDLISLIQMIQIIRRNNTGLEEDWCGVASSELSDTIRNRVANRENEFLKSPAERAQSIKTRLDGGGEAGVPISSLPSVRAPIKTPVIVEKEQENSKNSDDVLEGTIRVRTGRPTYYLTVPGSINPTFTDIPEFINFELVTMPPEGPAEIRYSSGSGTRDSFSLHLKSDEYMVPFPPGEYLFKFKVASKSF